MFNFNILLIKLYKALDKSFGILISKRFKPLNTK